MKQPIIHHWRWRSPKYLLTCGANNGVIYYPYDDKKVEITCKNCLRVMKSRGWGL